MHEQSRQKLVLPALLCAYQSSLYYTVILLFYNNYTIIMFEDYLPWVCMLTLFLCLCFIQQVSMPHSMTLQSTVGRTSTTRCT